MAKYPEIQQKCLQEIRSVLGDTKTVSFNKLNNLRYLDLVIKETMRMYPNVPMMARRLADELTIGIGVNCDCESFNNYDVHIRGRENHELNVPLDISPYKKRFFFILGNYTFPKGANLAFSPVILGRNPKLFQDPHEFRPERFLGDITTETFTYSFLPFSAGPRNCNFLSK